jgi:hypothetical protein
MFFPHASRRDASGLRIIASLTIIRLREGIPSANACVNAMLATGLHRVASLTH